jgi:hypothetical protein
MSFTLPCETEEAEVILGTVVCSLIELGLDGKWLKRKSFLVQTTSCLYYTVSTESQFVLHPKLGNRFVPLPCYLVYRVVPVSTEGLFFLKICCRDLRVLHLLYLNRL